MFLVPKDYFHFLSFANFGNSSYVASEKPGHDTHSEMLTYYCSLRISAKSVGTVSFFEIFDFEVDHFWPILVRKQILKYKYLNDALTHIKTTYIIFRKLLLRAIKWHKNCFFKLYQTGSWGRL